MNKKIVIISLVAVIVVAGGVVGGLYLVNNAGKSAYDPTGPAQPGTVLTADLSKDLGATSLVTIDTIKSALGSAAANVTGPYNLGRVNGRDGGESQTAVYPFGAAGTIEDGYGITNALSIELYIYKDKAAVDTILAAIPQDSTPVTGVGERAWLVENRAEGAEFVSYTLHVVSGVKEYSFKISQPTASATYKLASAAAALNTIAKSVTY